MMNGGRARHVQRRRPTKSYTYSLTNNKKVTEHKTCTSCAIRYKIGIYIWSYKGQSFVARI